MRDMASHGLTLMQLLIAIVVLGILAAISMPVYQQYVAKARIRAAQAALLENARFLEQFYVQKRSFKQTLGSWPELPIKQTEHFCIRFQGNPRNHDGNQFMLKAVALDKTRETRIIKLNQDSNFYMCQEAGNTCQDAGDFFANASGNEQHCEAY